MPTITLQAALSQITPGMTVQQIRNLAMQVDARVKREIMPAIQAIFV